MTGFDYQIVRKANRKTASIIVKANNEIEVRAPTRMPKSLIEQFVQNKLQWINRKRQFNSEQRSLFVPRSFSHGDPFELLGSTYTLQLQQGKRSVQIIDDELHVSHPDPQPENIRRQLTRWYRQQAELHFKQRCATFAEMLGKHPAFVGTKAYKSRWGSCHLDGRIYFNWRLILAPEWVVDYVVVHELCHLVHHNHSKAFWHLVATLFPDFKAANNWLKCHGLTLDL